MLLKEVKNWLTEYKSLNPSEVHTFAHTNSDNEGLIQALNKLFDTPPFDVQELDPVCHQLYEFYRSPERKLKLFALEYVPCLVWLYMRCLSLLQRKVCGGVETFLLGVYNLEIVNSDGTPLVESFRLPSLSQASIYHEQSRLTGVSDQLTEHALRQLDHTTTVWRSGPQPQCEAFNAQNRFSILSTVMQRYNKDLDAFHGHALTSVCKVSHRLSQTGFSWGLESSAEPRVTVSPALLVELMVAVYYAMFKGHQKLAIKAIESVHRRASYELYSDVILVTNALLHSHHRGNFHLERDDSIIKKTQKHVARGGGITNASFKAKKLPDDIDFTEGEDQRLAPLGEDEAESGNPAPSSKGIKARLSAIGGRLEKLGDRNKNRDSSSPRGDGDSPRGDPFDNEAVTPQGSKVMVDMLEMQPLSRSGRSHNGETEESARGEPGSKSDKSSNNGAPSTLGFSKKLGLSKLATPTFSSKKSNSSFSGKHSSSITASNSDTSFGLNGGHVNNKDHAENKETNNARLQETSSSLSFSSSFQNSLLTGNNSSDLPPPSYSSLKKEAVASPSSSHSEENSVTKREKISSKMQVNRNSFSTDL